MSLRDNVCIVLMSSNNDPAEFPLSFYKGIFLSYLKFDVPSFFIYV